MSKVCQLFSGSKGNCIFISCGNTKILVDAGVTAKRIENALSNIGEDASQLDGIFVTHEHSDHIKGIKVLASRYSIPVFASKKVIDRIEQKNSFGGKVTLEPMQKMVFEGAEIDTFKLSHDSADCIGYKIIMPDKRKIAVCTDTGYVTDDARDKLSGCDLVCLESNHEVTMVENGPYPYELKKRVLSKFGHLSNEACSKFALELANSGTTRFVLSHLSETNNYPSVARQATYQMLTQSGFEENKDFRLYVASTENHERPIIL